MSEHYEKELSEIFLIPKATHVLRKSSAVGEKIQQKKNEKKKG